MDGSDTHYPDAVSYTHLDVYKRQNSSVGYHLPSGTGFENDRSWLINLACFTSIDAKRESLHILGTTFIKREARLSSN